MSTRTAFRTIARILPATLISGAVAIGLAAPASAAPTSCTMGTTAYQDQLAVRHDSTEQHLANMVNSYRAQNGLPALRVVSTLQRPASWASVDSALRGFSPANHVDTLGRNIPARVQQCTGYTGFITEISYWGYGGGYYPTAEAALAWWKQSPGHNALLLDSRATTFGVGRAYMGHNAERQHWTVNFGNH